jgi:hypothetical protein
VTATRIELTLPVDGQCGMRIFRSGPGGGDGETAGGAA